MVAYQWRPLGNVCDAGMWLAWLGLQKLDANFGLHLDHVGFEQSALCQCLIRVLCVEERDANFKSGPVDLAFTGSLLPRSWLFGTCEACFALDANSVALGF